jgi:hypothetical protein
MIFQQLTQQLLSLIELLKSLSNEQYLRKIKHLGNASIGGHTRHIIELIQCVQNGYDLQTVDYLNRSRNLDLENSKTLAVQVLLQIEKNLVKADKSLKMVVENTTSDILVNTTYFREIVYNTEHTIHHLALIKVALLEMNLDLVNHDFGMAYSTIQYQASLAKV